MTRIITVVGGMERGVEEEEEETVVNRVADSTRKVGIDVGTRESH